MAKKRNTWKKQRRKAQDQGSPTPYGRDRGPNTGDWESIFSGWRGRIKYSREWNSGYNGSGRGTW